MDRDLVSMIVPVYNVEMYLEECLESICSQTYETLEILLIDDGSTDTSGKICDGYAKHDPRICVIHQKNQGLSAARNTGLAHASGKYLMFVDSDDKIAENLVEQLLGMCREHRAQIAVCSHLYYNEKKIPHRKEADIADIRIMEQEEAMWELCLDHKVKNFAWGKLYERQLFEGIFFPKGQLYEDINTTYKVFLKSERVVYTDFTGYFYRVRTGAITQTRDIYHALQRITAQQERILDLFSYQSYTGVLWKQLLYAYVMLAKSYVHAKEAEKREQNLAVSDSIAFLQKYQKEILKQINIDPIEKSECRIILKKGTKAFRQIIMLDYLHKAAKHIGIIKQEEVCKN